MKKIINFLEENKNKELIAKLHEYYIIRDLETNSVLHSKLFAEFYMTEKPLTYEKLSEKYNIDTKSLYRHKLSYNELAFKICQRQSLPFSNQKNNGILKAQNQITEAKNESH